MLGDRVQQGDRLEFVAGGPGARLLNHPAACRSTPGRSQRSASRPAPRTRRSRYSITSGKLWPVSTCISGNGNGAGLKAFSARRKQHDRILATAEQQHRALKFSRHLAHHVDAPRTPVPAGDSAGDAVPRRSSAQGSTMLYVDPALGLVGPRPAALTATSPAGCRGRNRSTHNPGRAARYRAAHARWILPPEVLVGPVGQRVVLPQTHASRPARSSFRCGAGRDPARGGCP